MNKVVVDVEFQGLIPPLAESEFMRLERKILAEGCTERLKVWRHGGQDVLIDGHNRLEICRKHGIPFDVEPVELKDRDAVKRWMIGNQLGRRNVNAFSKVQMIAGYYGWSPEKAGANKRGNLKQGKTPEASNEASEKKGKIAKKIADLAAIGRATVERALAIIAHGDAELIKQCREGVKTIAAAYAIVRDEREKERQAALERRIEELNNQQERLLRTLAMIERAKKVGADKVLEELKEVEFGLKQRIGQLETENREKSRQIGWNKRILDELKGLLGVDSYGDIPKANDRLAEQIAKARAERDEARANLGELAKAFGVTDYKDIIPAVRELVAKKKDSAFFES